MKRQGLMVAAIAVLALLASLHPARAWWRGGVWVGVPGPVFVAPPPIYYPPPAYYAPPPYYPPPPPVVYAPPPPPAYPAAGGPVAGGCYAGPYVCPLDHPMPAGAACYCLSNARSRVWGRVR